MTHQEKIDHLRELYPSLPDNLTVGGSLDLKGTAIASLPDNLTVGGSLDLRGTAIAALPDNLTVGGSLYLRGTAIAGAVFDCGNEKRTVCAYNHPEKGRVVSLGCFVGTEDECVEAINNKYSGVAALDYISKVKQAFAYKKSTIHL